MRRNLLPALIPALFYSAASFADVDLTIEGLDGELKSNVDAYLSSIPLADFETTALNQTFEIRIILRLAVRLMKTGCVH